MRLLRPCGETSYLSELEDEAANPAWVLDGRMREARYYDSADATKLEIKAKDKTKPPPDNRKRCRHGEINCIECMSEVILGQEEGRPA